MAKSLDQMKREAAKLQERIAFLEESEGKIIELAGQIRQAVKDAGLELADVIRHLKEPKTRAPRGTKEKKPESEDRTGAKPEVNVIYKHSSWPEAWTATGKRAPKHVIATIADGKTWAQLRAR